MSNLGFRIYTKVNRLQKELIEEFRNIPVANIADNMGRISCVASYIRPYNDVKLIGSAFTVRAPMGDNLLFNKAIDLAQPGDVIVVDGEGNINHSLCGDNMMTYAKTRGIAGFVVDGCIRDIESLKTLDFPVYAKGVNPNGPYKNGPGEINVPVSCGGQVVNPGDIILGDADGVIVIKAADAQSALEKAKAHVELEHKIMADILNGTLDRRWIDQILTEKGCEIIDD